MGLRTGVLRGGRRGSRAALEIGLAVLVAALAVGAVVGSGLAQTVLKTPDPLTWLRNNRGQVVQVNPETGAPLDRLQIGENGDPLQVVQGNGVLVVTNLRTNEVTIVDLSLLRTVGVRPGKPGAVKVLLAGRRIYLVDKAAGQIELLDPLTAATAGQWYADGPLADAAVDASGAMWALGQTGQLISLTWSDTDRVFVERARRDLGGIGSGAVLVAHDRGVTAIEPRGIAAQVGTGQDRTVRASELAAPLAAADLSPARLVPVSSPRSGRVSLVRPDGVVTVRGSAVGCRKPGKPAVYRDRVYAPCTGERKVIVLDAAGNPDGPVLAAPGGGEPELVLNAGLLIVNVPGARTGLVVKPDGTTLTIRTDDPRVPVHDPAARPTALPSGLGLRQPTRPPAGSRGQNPATSPDPRNTTGRPGLTPGRTGTTAGVSPGGPGTAPGGDGGQTPDATESPAPPAPTTGAPTTEAPTTEAPRPEDFTPSGVTAEARPDSTVLVSWDPPVNPPGNYRILRADTGEEVGSAAGGSTFAIVTGLALGQPVSFVVEAVSAQGSFPSPPSNPVAAFGRPAGPTIAIEVAARSPSALTLRVSVDVVSDGGSPVSTYDLTVSTGAGRRLLNVEGVPIGQRPYQFTAACTDSNDVCLNGGSVTATATLANTAGAGPPTTAGEGIPAPPGFAFGQPYLMVSTGGKCMDLDLRLHTCTGSAGQLWVHNPNGDIRNRGNGQCLAANDDLHFTGDGCSERAKRWTRVNVQGNQATIQNNDSGRECVYVTGDVGGDGVRVLDREGCVGNAQERWTAYQQPSGVPMTAAQPAAFATPAGGRRPDGSLGAAGAALLLLLPLAAGLVRRRHGRWPAR